MPSAHAASRSVWPWARHHLGLATLLPLAGIAVALCSSPGRWLGALSFAAGVLLALCLLILPSSLAQQATQRLAQARQASRT
ncbi:MAG: hypothetical protein EOO60_14340 [Hymenobacter sp.]|nr:MAG: hypothetical protein EOO60_14340 [Hymenobacter sp.]